MIPLIDGDLIAYRVAASCQKQGVVTEDFGIAEARANELLHNIVTTVGNGQEWEIYLSGGENYRKKINPEYKANRENVERPLYLEPLREWLVVERGAKVTDGIEADDMLGIQQTRYNEQEIPCIICSLDKDLRQVPGWHYSWEISGTSSTGKKWTKEAERLLVSPREGLFNFYWQLVMGDKADNVLGYDGKMRAKVPQFLMDHYHNMQAMVDEQELFDYVLELYQLPVLDFLINGTCLWVQRTEGDNWYEKGKQLLERNGTEVTGLKDDFTRSLFPLYDLESDVGSPNMTL